MKRKELWKLVWTNLIQNKFKVVLTSIGIVVGAATIVLVIAIGEGGRKDVADQFKNINAGAIDITYEMANMRNENPFLFRSSSGRGSSSNLSGGGSESPIGGVQNPRSGSNNTGNNINGTSNNSSNQNPSGNNAPQNPQDMPGMGNFPQGEGPNMGNMIIGGGSNADSRINQERIVLSETDVEDLEDFLPGASSVSISYTTRSTVDGGDLEEEGDYTVAGVKGVYFQYSNLSLQVGGFITDSNEETKDKVCILGASVAKEIFGSAIDAYDNTVYIDNRPYIVNGVLNEMGTVASGISPDDAIFIPYSTGVKYITGATNVSPTITVIAEDLNHIGEVVGNIKTILAESYPNAEFVISDAGSKMEAASASNKTLTLLLIAMASIVFVVGGIGIMNVLFVSVKERTNEIGILKAIGCSKKDILLEFLLEACFISVIGGILGSLASFGITPLVEMFHIRVELSVVGFLLALGFAIVTGTVFGFYPALKASHLVPIEALKEE